MYLHGPALQEAPSEQIKTDTRSMGKQPVGRYAWLMTSGFLLYTAVMLLGHIVGFPLSYAYLQTVCKTNCDLMPALTPENIQALSRVGLSITLYANLYIAIQTIYILACIGVAVLIVVKKPGQLIPLSVGLLLVGLSAYEGANYPALTAAYPFLSVPASVLINAIGMGPLSMYAFFTFPNGRFRPRWVLWLYIVYTLEGFIEVFIPSATTNDFLSIVFGIFDNASFPLIVFVLIYRSRTVLNVRERNAAKWIIYGMSVFIVTSLLVFAVLPALVPADSLWFLLMNTMGFFGCGINILGFLMAILHANAFDIDILINRTLVYVSLTIALALIYFGSVIGLQALVYGLIGQTSSLAVIASTLLIAALFQPLRRAIQTTIDKRFYRRKYDAARVLATFSATLRNEVDLEQLSRHLVGVVQESMQPAQVTLWLCAPRQKRQKE
ncbi:MAG: hypothetical protein J2P36_11445 [Ktedonobacteraceae bacterium]|nr:hypothetical protein [Ktedonobacteraceae bacterium]